MDKLKKEYIKTFKELVRILVIDLGVNLDEMDKYLFYIAKEDWNLYESKEKV